MVALDPMDPYAQFMAGLSYFKRGERARGKAAWERALTLAPNARTRARSRPPPRTGAGLRMAELDRWFEDYNEMHPHRALGMRSPRQFIRAHQPATCRVRRGQLQA